MSVILITGTSSGIGLATAVHFARKRHDVYAAVRNPTTAGALAEAMVKEPLPITRVTIDVDDASSVRRGVDEVLAKSGRVDVLVNNAGLGGGGPIEDVPIDWAKRSEEHTSELQSPCNLVCRLLLEKNKEVFGRRP